jgi:HSF-type DNA-binding
MSALHARQKEIAANIALLQEQIRQLETTSPSQQQQQQQQQLLHCPSSIQTFPGASLRNDMPRHSEVDGSIATMMKIQPMHGLAYEALRSGLPHDSLGLARQLSSAAHSIRPLGCSTLMASPLHDSAFIPDVQIEPCGKFSSVINTHHARTRIIDGSGAVSHDQPVESGWKKVSGACDATVSKDHARREGGEGTRHEDCPAKDNESPGDTFPYRLLRMMTETEAAGLTNVVSFLPDGKSIMIHKPHKFERDIMPEYFTTSRQVH